MNWQSDKTNIVESLSFISQDGYTLAMCDMDINNVTCPLVMYTQLLWNEYLENKNNTQLYNQVNELTNRCISYIKDLEIENESFNETLQHVDALVFTINEIEKLNPQSETNTQASNFIGKYIESLSLEEFINMKKVIKNDSNNSILLQKWFNP